MDNATIIAGNFSTWLSMFVKTGRQWEDKQGNIQILTQNSSKF